MFRVLISIIYMFIALVIRQIFPADVSLRMEAPEQVTAGTEFEVEIIVNKGDLESFSRFQQIIPAGLTAVSGESSNADFTFDDKRIRMIWLRLPRQEEFRFKYKVKVDERLKGTFNLKGKFSYIQDNERKSISLPDQQVYIQPSPTVDPALIVDISEFEDRIIQPLPHYAAGAEQIVSIRQAPYISPEGDAYIVNVLVNKENKQKFAKIEEEIPGGYSAVEMENKDAIFTFKDGKAKFLWMNMPQEPSFVVSYKLIPDNPQAPAPEIEGEFSFLEDEKTIVTDIYQRDIAVKDLSRDELLAMIPALKEGSEEITVQKPAEETTDISESYESKEDERLSTDATPPVTVEGSKKFNELKRNLPYLLEPESGIYYRVQVAAGHKPVDIKRYFTRFNLEKEVRKEYHEGWHKYSVGSFPVYKQARDYRVHIWNTTQIKDAFVSAYNTGERITVQEALMVANQQWYE